jgi:hypothetical protein
VTLGRPVYTGDAERGALTVALDEAARAGRSIPCRSSPLTFTGTEAGGDAAAVCDACPLAVKAACLRYGVAAREPGVWGGRVVRFRNGAPHYL